VTQGEVDLSRRHPNDHRGRWREMTTKATVSAQKGAPMRENLKGLMITLVSLFMLAGVASVLSACNTTAGAGRDVSAVGDAVTKGAEEAKP
jgi:predicted small secreted protein